MTQTISHPSHKGVICLFCGSSTSLPAQAEERHSAHPHEYLFSIIRCHRCRKEALYLPDEIIRLDLEYPPH